jgi:2-amino-4-hydroxy-6-hydroxymethyldihydropteridine diphosphokinase
MAEVYIALGSNLDDRLANLEAALQAMPPLLTVLERSPFYQTKPWGYIHQPDYLNMVVHARTNLAPRELLEFLKKLEIRLGRKPTFRYGPRVIDLDILFYDHMVIDESDLVIPHPRLAGRAFVLVPLADIAPNLRHPVLGETVSEMLKALDPSGVELWQAAA